MGMGFLLRLRKCVRAIMLRGNITPACRSRGQAARGNGTDRAGSTTGALLAMRVASSQQFAKVRELEERLKVETYCRCPERLAPERANNPGYFICILAATLLSSSTPFGVTITVPPMFTRFLPLQALGSRAKAIPGWMTRFPSLTGRA